MHDFGLSLRAVPADADALLSGLGDVGKRTLERITNQPIKIAQLREETVSLCGVQGLLALHSLLRRLDLRGALLRSVHGREGLLVTLRPYSPRFSFLPPECSSTQPIALSRLASVQFDGEVPELTCPLGHAALELHHPELFALLMRLQSPTPWDEACSGFRDLRTSEASACLLLAMMTASVYPHIDRDEQPGLGWEAHDLEFHTKSRWGRHLGGFGQRTPDSARPQLPVLKPAMDGPVFVLPPLAREPSSGGGARFTDVLGARTSVRVYGDDSLSIEELGEFLFRSARVKELPEGRGISLRPSPSGGACHALEIYPFVRDCSGLEPGVYHYRPGEHVLTQIAPLTSPAEEILLQAERGAGLQNPAQVLLVITARFARASAVYEKLAYSLTLKDVGALYQTMYLVATAMGIAPCALGTGDSDLFEEVTRIDYLLESSVGEFLLGSGSHHESPPPYRP